MLLIVKIAMKAMYFKRNRIVLKNHNKYNYKCY